MPTSHSPQVPPSFSTAHLARRLGVSVPTVQRWVDQGHLKAWKTVGGHRRIDAESAEAFIRAHARQGGGPSAESAAALSVLVVDDSADDRDLLCALVETALPGARVVAAPNGFDALIEVGKAMPDLIVAEVTLPHMDGLAMIRYLSRPGEARTPAIVAVSSGPGGPIDARGGLPPGIALLQKPVEPARFMATVNAALDGG
jgi:excisionase family DNA binding protein